MEFTKEVKIMLREEDTILILHDAITTALGKRGWKHPLVKFYPWLMQENYSIFPNDQTVSFVYQIQKTV